MNSDAVWLGGPPFTPEQLQGDAGVAHFRMHPVPVGTSFPSESRPDNDTQMLVKLFVAPFSQLPHIEDNAFQVPAKRLRLLRESPVL